MDLHSSTAVTVSTVTLLGTFILILRKSDPQHRRRVELQHVLQEGANPPKQHIFILCQQFLQN